MLRTRLWMGAVLIALTVGVLVLDRTLGPWYPFLLTLLVVLALVACHELLQLLGQSYRLPLGLCYASVLAVLLANWPAHLWPDALPSDPWLWVLGTFAAVVLLAFLVEMATFREPGESVVR